MNRTPQLKDMHVASKSSRRSDEVQMINVLLAGTDIGSQAMRLSMGLEPDPSIAARKLMDLGYSCWVSGTGCGCGMWQLHRPAAGCFHAYTENFTKLADGDAVQWASARREWWLSQEGCVND